MIKWLILLLSLLISSCASLAGVSDKFNCGKCAKAFYFHHTPDACCYKEIMLFECKYYSIKTYTNGILYDCKYIPRGQMETACKDKDEVNLKGGVYSVHIPDGQGVWVFLGQGAGDTVYVQSSIMTDKAVERILKEASHD